MINIYNEVEYAEKIISSGFVTRRKLYELSILAKYYFSQGKTKQEVFDILVKFCEDNMENFNKVLYFDKINNIVNTSKNSRIKNVKFIGLNQNDMNIIEEMPNIELKKVLTSIIVLCKIKHRTTGGKYINIKFSALSKTSHIKTTSKIRDLLRELVSLGKINICINGAIEYLGDITDDDEYVFIVKDFNNIGLYLMNYINHKYIECEECGKMMRKKNNSNKYCNECAKKRHRMAKLKYYYENQKENPRHSENENDKPVTS